MIHALVVDDESPARARMCRLLESTTGVTILGQAVHGLEALEKVTELKPDVIFLDIEMPELDGIAVAQALGADGPMIVFVTAYDEFALKAFETHAIDYLLKPVAANRLGSCIEKLKLRLNNRQQELSQTSSKNVPQVPSRGLSQDLSKVFVELNKTRATTRLAIRSGNKFSIVDLSRASAIIAKDHYSAIQIDGKELFADDPLEVFEKKLDPSKFLRVHRSAIINMDFIETLEREGDRKFVAVLTDSLKTRVPISRERFDEVKKWFGID